jgi:hypothetical protein
MTGISQEAAVAGEAHSKGESGVRSGADGRPFVLVALAAFLLYCVSALILEARGGTTHFGADAHIYSQLVGGWVDERVTRFHPVTTALAMAWMKVLSPLVPWIAPQTLLKGLFAAVGALGVWAAMWAFAAVVPRRYVVLFGLIYATSLGVWYFSSIEESKIVSATLTALYIAAYLHLRNQWTRRGAVLLTAILLLACLNEMVAAFLVAIPAVDTLLQRGWDLRYGRWIALHALAAPVALLFLEGVVNGHLVGAGTKAEGASHLSMLIFYVTQNDFSGWTLYSFFLKRLFFNIAAPSIAATEEPGLQDSQAGDFDPLLEHYFSSPVSGGLVVLFGAMLVAILLPRYRTGGSAPMIGLLLPVAAFAALRGAFFLVFNPGECLLFSNSATLAHLLLIGVPFAASSFPAKRGVLAAVAGLLFIVNGAFVIGQ